MPDEPVPRETRQRRRELLILYVLCAVFLVVLAGLWGRQRGYFSSAPVVEHTPADLEERPIELNTARWPELTLIRGIGPARAKTIADER